MVDQPHIRAGIDIVGSDYFGAQIERDDNNVRVLALSKIPRGDLSGSLLSENCSIVVAAPDAELIVKNFAIPQHYSNGVERIIRFELENSFPDDPEMFCIDTLETGDSLQFLAVVARQAGLERIKCELARCENRVIEPEGYLARSIALGRGFIRFCSNDTERMVCLADFAVKRVSLSFVLGNRIVALGGFDQSQFEVESESGLSRLVSELKTIINFKLNELVGRGLNVELERLMLIGGPLSENQKESIAFKLGAKLEEPAMNKILSDKPIYDSDKPLSSFLVSLGLATD